MITVGGLNSFSILYKELLDFYHTRAGDTASISSLCIFLNFAIGRQNRNITLYYILRKQQFFYSYARRNLFWFIVFVKHGCVVRRPQVHWYSTLKKFKVTLNSFSGPFANYASEIYSFRVVMFVGGFFGFLGLFLSAFVSRMELWILTYGVLSGKPLKVICCNGEPIVGFNSKLEMVNIINKNYCVRSFFFLSKEAKVFELFNFY